MAGKIAGSDAVSEVAGVLDNSETHEYERLREATGRMNMDAFAGFGIAGIAIVMVFGLYIAILLFLAPLKLFSIDATLKQILKELKNGKGPQ